MSRAVVGMEWLDEAACADMDPELFFPSKGADAPIKLAEARKVCERCPVRMPCLEYALANGERWGLWGGLNERERRRIKKRRLQGRAA